MNNLSDKAKYYFDLFSSFDDSQLKEVSQRVFEELQKSTLLDIDYLIVNTTENVDAYCDEEFGDLEKEVIRAWNNSYESEFEALIDDVCCAVLTDEIFKTHNNPDDRYAIHNAIYSHKITIQIEDLIKPLYQDWFESLIYDPSSGVSVNELIEDVRIAADERRSDEMDALHYYYH